MNLARLERIPLVEAVGRRVLAAHEWVYVHTDGRVGHRALGVPCLLLRTTGARSGMPRVNGLVYGRRGDRLFVVPSNGGADRAPSWYHNLVARPDCEAQVGRTRRAVHARVIGPDDPDFASAWELVNAINRDRYRNYQEKTSRPIPVVELTPRKG